MVVLPCLALLAVMLGGCAPGGVQAQRQQELSVLLEAPTSAVHAGIYVAAQRGFDKGEGLTLKIQRPRATTRPLASLRTERADAAIIPLEDFARARVAGADIVAVMALIQTPRLAVLASAPFKRPRQLTGAKVGVPPGREPRALLETMISSDGGDFDGTKIISLPEAATEALEKERADAVVTRRDSASSMREGAGKHVSVMLPERYGVPDHPGLLVVVNQTTLADNPDGVRSLARTLQRGYHAAQVDPESTVEAMLEREPRLDRATLLAGIDDVGSSWTAGAATFGELRSPQLQRWQKWAIRTRIIPRPMPREAFSTELVRPLRNP